MIFFKYLKYLLIHKWYVMIECFKKGLIVRGLIHDISKLLPDEFFPYMNWFYGKYGVEFENSPIEINGCKKRGYDKYKKCEVSFNKAWLKHQKRNKHHWQYWVLIKDSGDIILQEMPAKYIKEMACDWIGAGKAIKGRNEVIEYYSKMKDKTMLNEKSRKAFEKEIGFK